VRIVWYLLFAVYIVYAQEKYLDNHSCNECHEKIYEEYQSSAHSKGYFNDELHRKIADSVDRTKYGCAVCHMPMADNLQDLIDGKARPDQNNKTHTDAVSCYFCHTIAYVQTAHRHNINTKAKQAENFKPTLYGRLENPDDSDKHSSLENPIFGKVACIGCHSHKLNEHNVTIFRAMDKGQGSLGCIKCHMPQLAGGGENMDKKSRGHHTSHKFLGIHDKEFRKSGVDINISTKHDQLTVTLSNKMEHPLIIQPARAKFLKIEIQRAGKTIWQNWQNDPDEDKQGYFAYSFRQDGKEIIIPSTANSGESNNIDAKEVKALTYSAVSVKKGDKIIVSLWVQLAKSSCAKVIDLEDKTLMTPIMIKEMNFVQAL